MKPASFVPVIAAIIVLIGAYAYSVSRQSADLLLVQALHGSSAPVRAVANAAIGRLRECPRTDFLPATPIGFLIAAWDRKTPIDRIEPLLLKLEAIGCDIDRRGGHGLAPLHSAILFNNVDAVRLLLVAGADPGVVTKIRREDGSLSEFSAPTFANYLEAAGDTDLAAVRAILASGISAAGPPTRGQ